MDVREKLAFSVCNATQKTNYRCDFKCEKKGKCAHCLVMAEQMIAHGVTVQEWTSASEPPKDTYEYWIAYKAGGDYSYSAGYFDGKCWRSAITHKQIPVTHWQPMPKPPKGE